MARPRNFDFLHGVGEVSKARPQLWFTYVAALVIVIILQPGDGVGIKRRLANEQASAAEEAHPRQQDAT